MLSHELRRDEGLLILTPDGPLEASDFKTLTSHVDAYLENNGILRGVLVVAPRFPGWKNFSALLAHMRFVRHHHQRIERVAVVADGGFASIMPHVAQHFIHAEVRHFDPADENGARAWLKQREHAHASA